MFYKLFFIIFSFVVTLKIFAQPDSVTLKLAVSQLNESLLKKDTSQIKTLITNTLTYGHSNGWIQDERSLVADLYNGKLSYTNINQDIINIAFQDNIASVRASANVKGIVEGTAFTMKLNILQVWIKDTMNHWKLMARQSVKIL